MASEHDPHINPELDIEPPAIDVSDLHRFKPPLQEALEAQFPDNPAALSVNLLLVMGEGADDGVLHNSTGQIDTEIMGYPLQPNYVDMLNLSALAGESWLQNYTGCSTPYHSVVEMLWIASERYKEKGLLNLTNNLRSAFHLKKYIFKDGFASSISVEDKRFLRSFEIGRISPAAFMYFKIFSSAEIRRGAHVDLSFINDHVAHAYTADYRWQAELDHAVIEFENSSSLHNIIRSDYSGAKLEQAKLLLEHAGQNAQWAKAEHQWLGSQIDWQAI